MMYIDSTNNYLYNDGFKVCYDNKQAAIDAAKEIFLSKTYQFEADNLAPTILDVGSNIGLSVLFFKKLYPKSKIIAFEPSPRACYLLKKNLLINEIKGVEVHEAAITGNSGSTQLYGEHSESGYALGNSIIKQWGLQRNTSSAVPVPSVKLSSYINGPIDLLKLDIEGAEQLAITELGKKLSFIKEIFMEVHEGNTLSGINELAVIEPILKQYQFKVDVVEKDLKGVFPEETRTWYQTNNPKLYMLHAKNKYYLS